MVYFVSRLSLFLCFYLSLIFLLRFSYLTAGIFYVHIYSYISFSFAFILFPSHILPFILPSLFQSYTPFFKHFLLNSLNLIASLFLKIPLYFVFCIELVPVYYYVDWELTDTIRNVKNNYVSCYENFYYHYYSNLETFPGGREGEVLVVPFLFFPLNAFGADNFFYKQIIFTFNWHYSKLN